MYFAGSFPYKNPFGYHQALRARHFLIYAIMGGKQSFIKVVSLPYPFSLNAVSFMVVSGSSASSTTSSGSSASLTPSSGSSAYLTPSALMPSASWWRQGRQLCLQPRRGRQLRLLPHQGHQFRLLHRQGRQLRLLLRQGRQLCLLPRQGRQLTLPLQP